MSGIIFCVCLTIAFQFCSLLCCNGETISTRFRRRTSHSEIKTYDESYLRGRHRSCRLQLHWARGRDITENKILGLSSTDYSKLDYDRAWSSQEWKSEVTAHDRSGQPDNINSQEVADSTNFVVGNDAAEFVSRVNDQVRKKTENNVQRCRRRRGTFNYLENVYGCDDECSDIHGKEFHGQSKFHYEYNRSHHEEMFDISAKLVGEQYEISNVDKIHWEKHSWKHLSLIGDETVINLQRAKIYVFSDSVWCLGKIHQHPESNEAWKKRIEWIITDKRYRDYDGINGEPTEFEWNIFPGFTTLQLRGKSQIYWAD